MAGSICGPGFDLLRLDESPDCIRGIYLNSDVQKGDTILSVPLKYCIRDDEPPSWMIRDSVNGSIDDEDDNEEDILENDDELIGWASRLAASVVDLKIKASRESLSSAQSIWLSLLPNPSYLRASLPVHWPEDVLEKAKCSELELAVDTGFFSRANAVQNIMDRMEQSDNIAVDDFETRKIMIEDALDVVQTRSCRLVLENGRPVRFLAPVFDMINHHPTKVNAEFLVDDVDNPSLVVRALQDIQKDEEVLIDYGESARPDWKCLFSYGFVPLFEAGAPAGDGDHTAELFLEGQRFIVGPDSVSEELVYAMALTMSEADSEYDTKLTPSIALRLAQRISESAFYVLLDDEDSSASSCDGNSDAPETIISERLAASLRWSQHKILVACSLGLRDWAVNH